MRYLFLFFLVCSITETNWGQLNSPAFQTRFYFEDGVGNKDTILVSGDTIIISGVGFDYSAYRGDTVTAPDASKKFEVFTIPVANVIHSDIVFTPYVYYEGLDARKLVYYRNVVVHFKDTTKAVESLFLLFRCKNY
ncbi:MAG: hypothetical protein L6Q97_16325, partial [Thermoanaerobaculia bacterium]|nr:hypothetical protein [Thermoanaerobaculia bacterium]